VRRRALSQWRSSLFATTQAYLDDMAARSIFERTSGSVEARTAEANTADAEAAWNGPFCGTVLNDEEVAVGARLQLLAQYDPGVCLSMSPDRILRK
jgi:hypothetical protein